MKAVLNKLGIVDRQSFFSFVRQFFKFGIVGLSNTLLSLAIYYAIVYFGVNYIVANVVAFAISVLNAYYWNSRFVFKRDRQAGARSLAKVYAAYGVTFVLSTGLLYVMVDVLRISEYLAPLINLCVTVPLNFLLNKFWALK